MAQEDLQLLLWSEILFRAYPHGTDTVFVVGTQLGRARPDVAFAADDDEPACADDGEPIQVIGSAWDIRKSLMPRVDDVVAPETFKKLSKTEGVLVGEVHRPGPLGHQAARSLPAINSNLSAASTCSGVKS